MDSETIIPDPSFAALAFSISRDPGSWDQWACLQMEVEHETIAEAQNDEQSIKILLASHFSHIDGRIFFVDKMVYMICKNIPVSLLSDIGKHLCQMSYGDKYLFRSYNSFDLSADADQFIECINSHRAREGKAQKMVDVAVDSSFHIDEARIMLVEDDPVARWLVRGALKGICSLATAPCAHKAFDVYSSWQPSLVFLDIGLPDGDGYSVLRWILRNDPGANVVMVSANSGIDQISMALDLGAKGFISKPFAKEKLLHYIKKHAY